ncbi:MAG TPA: hypothetical protein PKW35_05075 [Nannocystaceae bacterium]|nr:hypothetical protein [Nannocystaceae bacterium]
MSIRRRRDPRRGRRRRRTCADESTDDRIEIHIAGAATVDISDGPTGAWTVDCTPTLGAANQP